MLTKQLLVFGMVLICAVGVFAATLTTPGGVEPTIIAQGSFDQEADSALESAVPHVITDKATLNTLWVTWKVAGPAPTIDFSKQIVIACTTVGSVINPSFTLKPDGNLQDTSMTTMDFRPGFRYKICLISLVGVQQVHGKPLSTPIPWGTATNELQAGLVPLGGVKGDRWGEGQQLFYCPKCADQPRKASRDPSIAAAARVCAVCAAAKPWSASFVEGEPMRMEVHFRNLAKEPQRLYRDTPWLWRFIFTPVGGGTSWQAYWAAPLSPPPATVEESAINIGSSNEDAVELALGPGWMFNDLQDRQLDIRTLPAGKYNVTASYAHLEHAQREPCPYWHGTVTTGAVEIEIKPDEAMARCVEAAKYAGFVAVAEVKTLPQADDLKPAQLGIEWKNLLYAPDAARQAMTGVKALAVADARAAAELKIGDRILVTVDERTVLFRATTDTAHPVWLDGAQWLSWSQRRQDALLAALAPGWLRGCCPWCQPVKREVRKGVCQVCQQETSGKICPECAMQRGECRWCKRKVGPATPGVTFQLWAYDPRGDVDGEPRNECRIKAGADSLPLWVEVRNKKGRTPEFQTSDGDPVFDGCTTLFYLIEGPGLSTPTPAFHVDTGARGRRGQPFALLQGSATGKVHLVAGKLFATPGTYTVRAVAGRLISNPVTVVVTAYTPAELADRAAQADAMYRQSLAELEAALTAAAAGASFDDLMKPYRTIEEFCRKLHELGARDLSDRLRRELQTRLEPRMKPAIKD